MSALSSGSINIEAFFVTAEAPCVETAEALRICVRYMPALSREAGISSHANYIKLREVLYISVEK